MTEPDEALLWARAEYATLLRPFDVGPQQDYISEAILNGLWDDDVAIRHSANGYRAGAAASAERIKELEARVAELEAALVKANEPLWFYSDEEGTAWRSMEEAVEGFCDDLEPGRHLVEIGTARPCPTIWGVVHVFTKTELEDQHRDGGPFEGAPHKLTVCATEAEARALLKEPDQ